MSRSRSALLGLVALVFTGCALTGGTRLGERLGRRATVDESDLAGAPRSSPHSRSSQRLTSPIDEDLMPASFPPGRRGRAERSVACPPTFASGPEIRGGTAMTVMPGPPPAPGTISGSDPEPQSSNANPASDGAKSPGTDARGKPARTEPAKLDPHRELRKGDRLEVRYLTTLPENASYALMPGDVVKVEYLHLLQEDPDTGSGRPSTLDREVRVGPDGQLSLPHLKSFPAVGKTVDGLRDFLNKQYETLYVEPNLHVSLVRGGVMIDELRRASGADEVQVGDDGRIRLERLGMSQTAVAFTIGDLEKEINERLRARLPGVTVRFQAPDGE